MNECVCETLKMKEVFFLSICAVSSRRNISRNSSSSHCHLTIPNMSCESVVLWRPTNVSCHSLILYGVSKSPVRISHHRSYCFMPQFFSISNNSSFLFPFQGGRDQFEPLTIIFVTDKKDRYIPVSWPNPRQFSQKTVFFFSFCAHFFCFW